MIYICFSFLRKCCSPFSSIRKPPQNETYHYPHVSNSRPVGQMWPSKSYCVAHRSLTTIWLPYNKVPAGEVLHLKKCCYAEQYTVLWTYSVNLIRYGVVTSIHSYSYYQFPGELYCWCCSPIKKISLHPCHYHSKLWPHTFHIWVGSTEVGHKSPSLCLPIRAHL